MNFHDEILGVISQMNRLISTPGLRIEASHKAIQRLQTIRGQMQMLIELTETSCSDLFTGQVGNYYLASLRATTASLEQLIQDLTEPVLDYSAKGILIESVAELIKIAQWLEMGYSGKKVAQKEVADSKDAVDRGKIITGVSFRKSLSPVDRGLFPEHDSRTGDPTEDSAAKQPRPKIGIVTALPKEFAAVKEALESNRDLSIPGRGAGRRYLLGEVPAVSDGRHLVVATLADMGNNSATGRATLLLEHFPSVDSIIMVGIAGGVPFPEEPDKHVRLGDIVVSDHKGIIQYDFVKEEIGKTLDRYPPRPPSASLLESVRYLQAEEIAGKSPWLHFIDQIAGQLGIQRPPEETDILASSSDPRIKLVHPKDSNRVKGKPRIHFGPVASANKLLKNPIKRDELRDKLGVRAVEMEGSGIADATWNHEVGYLVIRGVCDYCDSNKGDDWQAYATVVASAYMRALLESIPVQKSRN